MGVMERVGTTDLVRQICNLKWERLTADDLTDVAWAYHHFSIQFRESLERALVANPHDAQLRRLAAEECDTANLSPWPGVASVGERMDHDTFMQRLLALQPVAPARRARLCAAGAAYLAKTRSMPDDVRAMSIVSYEDGGLEDVFHAVLGAPIWDTALLSAFRHFLSEHIRFDSDPDAGHGSLARHIPCDHRVRPLWTAFHHLLVACVPALA